MPKSGTKRTSTKKTSTKKNSTKKNFNQKTKKIGGRTLREEIIKLKEYHKNLKKKQKINHH